MQHLSTTIIKTSGWFVDAPPGYCRILISRGYPRGQRGFRCYPKLAPGLWFKDRMSPRGWAKRHAKEVLNHLDPEQIVRELVAMSQDTPLLLCAEGQPGEDPA